MAEQHDKVPQTREEIDITPQPQGIEDGELPTSDKGYKRLGGLILLLALGGFVAWSLTATLAVAVVAPGSVSSESFKRTVQHLEGGMVREILVEDGDYVEAGQPLIVLSDTQARAQLQISQALYLINRAMEVRLLAEQQGSEVLSFPDDLMNSDMPRVQEVLAVQQSLFTARRESLHGTLTSLDEQVVQMREQIDGLEARMRVNRSRIASLRDEAEDFRSLYREGLGDNQRLRELERQILQYEGENASHQSEIARLRSRISENQMQKEVRRQEFQQEVGEQLRQAQAQIAEAEERITSLSDQVERTTIMAPVSGTVVGRQVHTVGAVIRPGDPVMDIVPSNDGFVVEARIPSRDIDNIYRGQHANIRFSAFNQRLTDEVDGEVIYVSADSFEDESTGMRYYRARIGVTEEGSEQMTEQMELLSGMPAEVMIRTGERTFASYIAKPIGDMLARAIRED
ncbi:HlyD family type I secretion periplasmic adaptor subunit [Halomonas pacifica]|uniref:Membrane fusion protein (MFP) family protein n=1 Tax=Bisbaumannia pacifica TaxID=77098 RepID=A0A510XA65_9GAMM|nr:HlyD family type I secretion periplasmic adaptor subunit [Halomonas pacifica]MBH8581145.1 HlyD family type I secretion periplasmic adaptor subunit [Halomonas pacifica]MDC8803673.1 HlyD family type I secretion periplasmic adaptor subunit [Halomonas pacifica]GEK48338.1 HlyD family type I secretion periplasmic adaptor subunit [Halomonas pacifica]